MKTPNELIMISAMYENGGNVTHRHLDGHPDILAYPFESQLGTKYDNDEQSGMYPFKYRWPTFPLGADASTCFELMFDEELKTRLRRPEGSKFRDAKLEMTEANRKKIFLKYMEGKSVTTANVVTAFFMATFDAWINLKRSGDERYLLGYSPIVGVDAERIFSDLPDARVLHVVRDPIAAVAETRRRPYPLSLSRYLWTWAAVQHRAIVYRDKYPERFLLLRYEDILHRKEAAMKSLAGQLGIDYSDTMLKPSFNGEVLDSVFPWGTIDTPDPSEQQTRRSEIPADEVKEGMRIVRPLLAELGYEH